MYYYVPEMEVSWVLEVPQSSSIYKKGHFPWNKPSIVGFNSMTMDTPPFLKVDVQDILGSSSPQKSSLSTVRSVQDFGVREASAQGGRFHTWGWNHGHGGTPRARWRVDFLENPNVKFRMNRGTPPFMETPTCGNSKLRKTCLFSFWVSHLRSDGQTVRPPAPFCSERANSGVPTAGRSKLGDDSDTHQALGNCGSGKPMVFFPGKRSTHSVFFGGFRHLMLVYSGTF